MKNIILNNLGVKLLSLLLAVVTWFYIVEELQRGTIEEREMLQKIIPYKMVSKKIPIKLNLTGKPKEGYIIDHNKIAIEPSSFVMVGPKSVLHGISSVDTQPVDVSGLTKTVTKDISIASPVKGVALDERFVSVTIPIVRIEE